MKYIELKERLENDKEKIFANLPDRVRPIWGNFILTRFSAFIDEIPNAIQELFEIVNDEKEWFRAKEQFKAIRDFNLKVINFQPTSYIGLAELVAKITFNASGSIIGPFDGDSGLWITTLAFETADYFRKDILDYEVIVGLSIASKIESVTKDIKRTYDLIEFKKIDDILWFNWDPLGMNDTEHRDEYQDYTADIFNLKRNDASVLQIANHLYDIELNSIGAGRGRKSCIEVAERIYRL
ncbi:hypothetical protein [Leptospira licerasiae]|uniref:hypothetical protein n=1 Tax=Leptospira licerasiae TaxID=447106 RepID=UPI001083B664|nr:hypothetical protein [Leptospira licerasiae]TGM85379.1 hypothetical protein EHR05_19470 [Leptospira licerasiae]